MACGLSPEMAAMLAQMSKEKERDVHVSSEELAATMEYNKKVQDRYNEVQAKQAASAGYDWTRPYEKWEAYEDPEDLAAKEQAAREKAEHAAMRQSCNHDHSAEQKLMDMTTAAKMEKCDHFRRLGNRFFAHAQYQRAAYHYHRALIYFEYMFSDTDAEQAEMDALKKRILLNFALCRLKTRHLDQALHHATLALKLDDANVKAKYICAVVYRMQDHFDDAQRELDAAIALSPSDAALAQELRTLVAKKAAYRVKSKQLGAAMFQTAQPKARVASRSASLFQDTSLQRALDLELRPATSAMTDEIESWRPSAFGAASMAALLGQLSGDNGVDAALLVRPTA
ncbi:hypothetical protein SDRG_10902 [Saprolegnia diclina VS20]|uniref:Uncharacterized protein n=1 Tax=Saprolegnia diclina (strain VS20) TaxID=1156394 RepID=T0Q0C1_SAPDV|nr:hypothetical protein SDRG_10902 [Saprolegnia diclina VS20]EQC31299.1 hypothetical protein SDRG_10902 [Saprolegnia diclina VS20]|eukprot:XP_008615140.1 hypothetical protein SDRG_10902 [Saprolegnia diclina VS20]